MLFARLSGLGLVALALAFTLVGCRDRSEPTVPTPVPATPVVQATATAAPSPTAVVTLTQLVTAHDVDDQQRPVGAARSFSDRVERIYAVAHFAGSGGPLRVTIRWLAVQTESYAINTVLLERSIDVSAGDRYGFSLAPTDTGFPVGVYRADLYLADQIIGSAEFTIRRPEPEVARPTAVPPPAPTPGPAGSHGIVAVLAVGITESHEPIGTSDRFAPDVEAVYLVFTATDLPPGSALEAIWIAEAVDAQVPPDYEIDRSTLAVQGTLPGAFWLSRPDNGFPTGAYRVDLLLHGQGVGSYPFTIE